MARHWLGLLAGLCLCLAMGTPGRAASDCSTVAATHSAALAACGVTSLTQLFASDVFSEGAVSLCVEACVTAISAARESANRCADASAVIGATEASGIEPAFREQLACAPPQPACLLAFRDMQRWLASVTCVQDAASAQGAANGQSTMQGICGGECQRGFDNYLGRLEAAGCSSWNAYRQHKMEFSLICASAGGQFCNAVFSPALLETEIDTARNNTEPLAARDTALTAVCTPCFFEHARIIAETGAKVAEVQALEELCVIDQSRFCFPRFQDALTATANAGITVFAQTMCQGSLGNCAAKMLARSFTSPTVDARTKQLTASHLRNMCLRNEGRAELCATSTAEIASGYAANGSFIGDPFKGPAQCEPITPGAICTWGCQRRFEVDVSEYNCCYESSRLYLQELALSNVAGVFQHLDLVQAECERPVSAACTRFNEELTMELTIPLPILFNELNGNVTYIALLSNDIQRLLGVAREAFDLLFFDIAEDGTSATVRVSLTGQTVTEVAQLVAAVNADITVNRFVPFQALQLFGTRERSEA